MNIIDLVETFQIIFREIFPKEKKKFSEVFFDRESAIDENSFVFYEYSCQKII
jgi:hypothetical protein